MSLKGSDYIGEVNKIFGAGWQKTAGRVVPSASDLPLSNSACEMDLTMLFIDIRESTAIVDTFSREVAAKMYKSFLWGVAQLARRNGGELRSFNGDGVLMVFSGQNMCANAVRAALQMNWFGSDVLRPKVATEFKHKLYKLNLNFGIGIHTGKVLVIRGGIKGNDNNDLVWVGNATNFAVKYSSMSKDGLNVHVSKEVYDALPTELRSTPALPSTPSLAALLRMPIWATTPQANAFSQPIYCTNYKLPIPEL